MKTKIIAIVALAVLLVGVAIYAFKLGRDLEKERLAKREQTTAVQTEAEIIARKVDQAGLEHVTIEESKNVLPYEQAKESAVSPGILDTTAMAIGILKKQIENLTSVNTTLKAENLKAKQLLDANNRPVYNYTDKWLNLTYKPGNPSDTTDKGAFDFKYNADLNITQYWKRSWFLGAKKSYIDIYSNDPRTTVNTVKRLTVEHKQPTFGLRVQAASTYSFSEKMIQFGPGIQFDINRFSVTGSYYYNVDENAWRPTVGARYDIIRF